MQKLREVVRDIAQRLRPEDRLEQTVTFRDPFSKSEPGPGEIFLKWPEDRVPKGQWAGAARNGRG